MIDYEKRKRIMQRSIRLGHCICDPRQKCPCDVFRKKSICHCAGEREETASKKVKLTRLVENAGCASKIKQDDLKKVLKVLPKISHPNLLVGANTCDDAGVYLLNKTTALVETVDVFTPNVDDPYTFGRIAAANSLSDVYAMGGRPLTALSIIGFPVEKLGHRIMAAILKGGIDTMEKADVTIAGGHSINDREIKFGFAVTGIINPRRIITNSGARTGDALVLTKPLGTGIISFAAQMGRASAAAVRTAIKSMTALNRKASELMIEFNANAATDVTGFGLLGHLGEMTRQSGMTAEIYANRVPVFPEALRYSKLGIISGAIERNREYAERFVKREKDVDENLFTVFFDPQTSGGLLVSLPEKKAASFVNKLRKEGNPHAAVIGLITGKSSGIIIIR